MLFKSLISSVSNVSSSNKLPTDVSCYNSNNTTLFDENTITNRNINKTTFFTRPNYISM